MKLEIGHYYKNRVGVICGPVRGNAGKDRDTYPFYANDETFTANGIYFIDNEDDLDLVEDVTHLFNPEQLHTFPTLEEFRQWRDEYAEGIESIYDYFRTRTQPLEIGREYEFSDNRREWIRAVLNEYVTNIGHFEHIRPIQPKTKPKPNPNREQVLEAVINARNVQDGDMLMIGGKTIDAVIKLLEGEK
jgi:hypothetical protein